MRNKLSRCMCENVGRYGLAGTAVGGLVGGGDAEDCVSKFLLDAKARKQAGWT